MLLFSKYCKNKFVYTDKYGHLALLDMLYHIKEAHSMTLKEDDPSQIEYRVLKIGELENVPRTPLIDFLSEHNYSPSDFRNPFTRTFRIVSELHAIEEERRKSSDKQKAIGTIDKKNN